MVYVSKQKRRRIGNGDEKQVVISTKLDTGGPQAAVYFDPELGAPGRDFVESGRHITGHFGATADGSICPVHSVFDSTATTPENFGVDSSWARGLPRVQGKWGHADVTTFEPSFDVSASGSTSELNASGRGGFVDYLEKAVLPLFPDISPTFEYESDGSVDSVGDYPIKSGPVIWLTDLGPGRLVADVPGLERRQAIGAKGLIVYPSCVPNLSGPQQVMDQLYGELQAGMTANANKIVAERRKAAGQVIKANKQKLASNKKTEKVPPVNLTNAYYPRILNGLSSDPLKKKPFEYVFSPENVLRAWDDTGTISKDGYVTMKALHHPKVRPGAAIFEDDDEELEGEAGSRQQLIKRQLVKHEENLAICRSGSDSNPPVTDSVTIL